MERDQEFEQKVLKSIINENLVMAISKKHVVTARYEVASKLLKNRLSRIAVTETGFKSWVGK